MREEVRVENCSDFSHISKMTVELFTILWYNLIRKVSNKSEFDEVIG